METIQWKAKWIWHPQHAKTVNFHLFGRKVFNLKSVGQKAILHITAMTDYILYINGEFMGRGPTPSDPATMSYDTYDLTERMIPGDNILAVACHNYGIGTHWQYAGPGGLFAQLEVDGQSDKPIVISDESWKIRIADCYPLDTPRAFWSCGFVEIFDGHRYPEGWELANYDDSSWEQPIVLGSHPTRPWKQLLPREIPFLKETLEFPLHMEKGVFSVSGIHIIRFDGVINPGVNAIGYAKTRFYCTEACKFNLQVECDDAFKVLLNQQMVYEIGVNYFELSTKLWRGYDEFEQVHYGLNFGYRTIHTPVQMNAGWNDILVVIDQGEQGWGASLVFLDENTGKVVDLPYSSEGGEKTWTVSGPHLSSGLSDSLDTIAIDGNPKLVGIKKSIRSDDQLVVSDHSLLMHLEERRDWKGFDANLPLVLGEGEFCIYDFGRIKVGYPDLIIETSEDAVLDIGYNSVFFVDRRIRFSQGGAMRNVDRLYLQPGVIHWQPFQRRNGRFMHMSCRKGKVTIRKAMMHTIGYPVELLASFECSDELLNQVWETSVYTSRLLMQHGYQDCLKREQGTCNTYQATYQSMAAAYAFGDHRLARKNLLYAIRTQQDDGWFHAHGPSSPNQDETTLCFFWLLWLRQYYWLSGDRQLVEELFEAAEDNLRFFAKSENRWGLIDSKQLIVSRPGQLAYIDDTQCNGVHLGHFDGELLAFNLLYQAALKVAGELAGVLGKKDRVDFYKRKADRVRENTNARLWDANQHRYVDWGRGEEKAKDGYPVFQISAVDYGLSDPEQTHWLMRYIVSDLGIPDKEREYYPLSTFNYYNFLNVLFEHGESQQALQLIRNMFGEWVKAGGTAFDEHCPPSRLRDGNIQWEYEVHGYGTSAHAHYYTHILGIQPAEPGFTKVRVAPCPGDLKWATGKAATPQGMVSVAWQVDGDVFSLAVETPSNVGCNFAMPGGFHNYKVSWNGHPVEKKFLTVRT